MLSSGNTSLAPRNPPAKLKKPRKKRVTTPKTAKIGAQNGISKGSARPSNRIVENDPANTLSRAISKSFLYDEDGNEYVPKDKVLPNTYYWAKRSGEKEIVLTSHCGKYIYLHGLEHMESVESPWITMVRKIWTRK